MVVALLGGIGLTALTGVLMTSDWFWGDERMELLHQACAWTVTALVPLHVAGVLFTSWRHRENLVRAMLDGYKRAAREGDMG
jgi:cytochrome b